MGNESTSWLNSVKSHDSAKNARGVALKGKQGTNYMSETLL